MKAARYARSSAVAENYVGALRSMLAKDKGHRRDNNDHRLGLDDRQGARRTDPNPAAKRPFAIRPLPGVGFEGGDTHRVTSQRPWELVELRYGQKNLREGGQKLSLT